MLRWLAAVRTARLGMAVNAGARAYRCTQLTWYQVLSVTTQPSVVVSMSYAHSATGNPSEVTRNAKRRLGSAAVTVAVVHQWNRPRWLWPRNRAPTRGPVSRPSQALCSHSTAHSGIPGTSL